MKANRWIILAVILLVAIVLVVKQRADRAETGPPATEETVAQTDSAPAEEEAVALLPSDQDAPADTAPPSPAAATPAQGKGSVSSAASPEPAAPPQTSPPPPAQAEEKPPATAAAEGDAGANSYAGEQAPAEPRREKPLPGGKLAECLKSGRPTLAEFGAGWCPACQLMEPVIEEAAAKYKGKAHVVYVDVMSYGEVARRHGIRPIPTQIFFGSDGKEASRHIGYYPLTEIDRELAALGVTP